MVRNTVIFAIVIMLSCWVEAEKLVEVRPLSPDKQERQLLKSISKTLLRTHYSNRELDGDFASQLFSAYLESLDPWREFFLVADVERLSLSSDELILALRGEGEAVWSIYNSYREVAVSVLREQIESVVDCEFTFNDESSVLVDRGRRIRSSTNDNRRKWWDKKTKGQLLDLIVNHDYSLDAACRTVAGRLQQQVAKLIYPGYQQALVKYVNALTSMYDWHTRFRVPKSPGVFSGRLGGGFVEHRGLGVVFRQSGFFPRVQYVEPESPACKSGLRAGDVVLNLSLEDGTILWEGWRGKRLSDFLSEFVGQEFKFRVLRGSQGDVSTVDIVFSEGGEVLSSCSVNNILRASSKNIDVRSEGVDYQVDLISIPAFYSGVSVDVRGLLSEGREAESRRGVILDLRGNGGGELDEAVKICGFFLGEIPVGQMKSRSGEVSVLRSSEKQIFNGPLIVFVDAQSASSSEFLAAALQDYRRAVVVGGVTSGKGTAQENFMFGSSQLSVTTKKIYRVTGDSNLRKGVSPDICFPDFYDSGERAYSRNIGRDDVASVKDGKVFGSEEIVERLRSRSQNRMGTMMSMQVYREYIDGVNKKLIDREQKKFLSLNLKRRINATVDEKELSLVSEGLLRSCVSLCYEELRVGEYHIKSDLNDFLLVESVRVMVDFVSLVSTFGAGD